MQEKGECGLAYNKCTFQMLPLVPQKFAIKLIAITEVVSNAVKTSLFPSDSPPKYHFKSLKQIKR